MSMMLTAKAMSLKVGNPIRKLVLLKLADQANDKGECWPSYQSIAEAAECSRRSVIEHIEWLREKGYLKIEKRAVGKGQNLTNVYHLTLEKGGESPALGGESPALGGESPALGGESPALGGESPALGGESPALGGGESAAPEPVNKNQSMNQSMNQYGNAHAGASASDAPVLPDQPDTLADGWDGNNPDLPAKPSAKKSGPDPDNVRTWQAYARAYRERYGVLPASNAKTRGQTAQFVRLVGREVAPALAAFYVWHSSGYFVQRRHDFGCLLQSYQQVLTDMQRGEQMTATKARQTERQSSNMQNAAALIAKYEREAQEAQGV